MPHKEKIVHFLSLTISYRYLSARTILAPVLNNCLQLICDNTVTIAFISNK